jgi:regulatory protein
MGSGDGLARVTYLPGVVPPPSPELPEAERPPGSSEPAGTAMPAGTGDLPDFASFFGEDSEAAAIEEKALDARGESASRAPRGKREVRVENVSMHALTRRGLSRWELEKTLSSRELDEETIAAELDRLEGVGLIDDAALAETFVRTQHERKGLGRGALTAELRRRHIDQELIDAALEQVDDDDEQSRATELAVKRASQLSSYDLDTAKRRLTAFLMRKGYSSSVVRAATDEALSSRSSGVRFR